MREPYEVRQKYGGVYVTAFDDGLIVPWRPLDLGSFIKYTSDFTNPIIPFSCIEDEIFKRCVVDNTLVRQLPFLKAGIISTVVQNIWQLSGPSSIEGFNEDLAIARSIINGDLRSLHNLVDIICMAYPYKPEEVYAMEYETLMLRAVQAEEKLMTLGIIKESIDMKDMTKIKQKRDRRFADSATQDIRPSLDAKKLWEQQQQQINNIENPQPVDRQSLRETGDKWYKVSPVLEATKKHNIDIKREMQIQDRETGRELDDPRSDRARIVADAQWIYKDLIAELNKRKVQK
jgi:hypothetical protein